MNQARLAWAAFKNMLRVHSFTDSLIRLFSDSRIRSKAQRHVHSFT